MSSSIHTPSNCDITGFQEALKRSQHIIVIAGAGLSAASGKAALKLDGKDVLCTLIRITKHAGIPTFRGAGGMWRSLDATNLATPEAFEANPSLVWQFYHHRRVK